MTDYAFRIVNVFARSAARRQSARGVRGRRRDWTTRRCRRSRCSSTCPRRRSCCRRESRTARVRIFTPSFEMPFAGHPTLGTAHVVRAIANAGDRVTLEMRAGIIPVAADGDVWTLTANAPRHRQPVGIARRARGDAGPRASTISTRRGEPLWVDTGSEQLVIPLASFDAVRRAQPSAAQLLAHGNNGAARDGVRVRARGRRACSRASSFRSTARSSRTRAPARRARTSAAGCSRPARRCRSG